IVVVADWLYQPPLAKLSMRQLGYWLIYPFLYLAYSLIRGAIVGFYPYPFLNPASPTTGGGYGGVALYCVAIFVAFLLVGWVLIGLANTLPRSVATNDA
ncbi:MAG TPA: Pr6Pr family membrane protein, partial [Ktedonobacterales bacterium]